MIVKNVDGINVPLTDVELAAFEARQDEPAGLPETPDRVTNYQGRHVMRLTPYGDGSMSLFTRVDTDLRAAVAATKDLPEFDPARVQADIRWQAWEQANEYEREGDVTRLLAAEYGILDAQRDGLFRQASTVRA